MTFVKTNVDISNTFMAAPKQPATITARKGDRVKKFRTTVWNLLPKEKNGWEQISGVVETPVEAKKVSAPVENKVSIETPPEAVKTPVESDEKVALPPKTVVKTAPKAKAKAKKK